MQRGEYLLIEPVVRVHLGPPPPDDLHALGRRDVDPVVVVALIVARLGRGLDALLLGTLRSSTGGLVSVVLFLLGAFRVGGLVDRGRGRRALHDRRLDGDRRHRERCELGAIAHRQRHLERRATHRIESAYEYFSRASSANPRFSSTEIWRGVQRRGGALHRPSPPPYVRSVAREPDESRVYHLKSKPAAASPPIARARPARAAPKSSLRSSADEQIIRWCVSRATFKWRTKSDRPSLLSVRPDCDFAADRLDSRDGVSST